MIPFHLKMSALIVLVLVFALIIGAGVYFYAMLTYNEKMQKRSYNLLMCFFSLSIINLMYGFFSLFMLVKGGEL